MRKVLGAAVLLSIICPATNVLAEGMFTPPALSAPPWTDERTTSFGLGYYFQKTKLGANFDEEHVVIEPKRRHIFAQLGFRLSESVDGYLRAGAADFDFTDSGFKFQGSDAVFASLGLNAVLYQSRSLSVGPTLQVTYNGRSSGKFADNTTLSWKGGMPGGISDVTGGIAAQYMLPYNFAVYGGPFVYWMRFEATATNPGIPDEKITFREEDNFGGFAGIRYSPIRNLDLFLESVLKGKFGYGASLAYYF